MDSILIFPPGPSVAGSQLQIGTYLMYDPGADYGAKGLIQSIESQNALHDGGVFAYRNVGPRHQVRRPSRRMRIHQRADQARRRRHGEEAACCDGRVRSAARGPEDIHAAYGHSRAH